MADKSVKNGSYDLSILYKKIIFESFVFMLYAKYVQFYYKNINYYKKIGLF